MYKDEKLERGSISSIQYGVQYVEGHVVKSQKCSGFLLAKGTIVLCPAFGSKACIFKLLFRVLLLGPLAGNRRFVTIGVIVRLT